MSPKTAGDGPVEANYAPKDALAVLGVSAVLAIEGLRSDGQIKK